MDNIGFRFWGSSKAHIACDVEKRGKDTEKEQLCQKFNCLSWGAYVGEKEVADCLDGLGFSN